MKKITLFMMLFLALTGVAKATEIWTGSCTIGSWSGSSVTVKKESFENAAAGNIIKVTISAYQEVDGNETTVTYWQYSLGQKDNGWAGLTGFSGGDLSKGQASASYILTETNVTELKNYGLSVNGRFITVTKVELLTSTSESIWTGTTKTGDWSTNVALTYNDKGNLANAQLNDYIRMTYTVTASGAQAAIQNSGWSSIVGKDDNSYDAEGDNTGKTLMLTIDDAVTLENIQHNGVLLRGKNITITSLDLIKPDNRYDAVPLTIGSDGICTYGSSKNLDFSGISGVTPYYVSEVGMGSVTLTPVSITRAWAGYIVQGNAGTYSVPVTASEPEWIDAFHNLRYSGDYNDNWVYRSAYAEYAGGGDNETKIKTYYRYIFAKKEGGEPSFYKLATDYSRVTAKQEGDNATGSTVYYCLLDAHKAYLETSTDITASGVKEISLVFEDESTGLHTVNATGAMIQGSSVYYDLQGRRVAKAGRGLYIVNGKKIVVK